MWTAQRAQFTVHFDGIIMHVVSAAYILYDVQPIRYDTRFCHVKLHHIVFDHNAKAVIFVHVITWYTIVHRIGVQYNALLLLRRIVAKRIPIFQLLKVVTIFFSHSRRNRYNVQVY